jgi:hypothetical protein
MNEADVQLGTQRIIQQQHDLIELQNATIAGLGHLVTLLTNVPPEGDAEAPEGEEQDIGGEPSGLPT